MTVPELDQAANFVIGNRLPSIKLVRRRFTRLGRAIPTVEPSGVFGRQTFAAPCQVKRRGINSRRGSFDQFFPVCPRRRMISICPVR